MLDIPTKYNKSYKNPYSRSEDYKSLLTKAVQDDLMLDSDFTKIINLLKSG
jgi:hypothetical protein